MANADDGLLGQVLVAAVLCASVAVVFIHRDELMGGLGSAAGPSPRIAVQTPAGEAERRRGASTTELRISRDGHYHTEAEVNGSTIDVLVDTGATMVALTYEDAERVGVRPAPSDFTMSVSTANGRSKVAPVRLARVAIGNIMVRNVDAAVVERGKLSKTLLGMSFLGKLSRVEMRNGVLALEE